MVSGSSIASGPSALTGRVRAAPRPRRGLITGADAAMLAAANVVLVVGLWADAGGLAGPYTATQLLTSAGRLTGLLGTLALLIGLLLLARLPVLERSVGFDRLTVWHRISGRAAITLLLAHAGLITAGYALAGRISLPAEVSRLLLSTPGILTATAGTLLLVAVAASSVVIARRRLRYETWYFVHLYAYLGIALAFSHQIATGASFVADPVARAYWWTLYGGTLAALLGFRVARPLVSHLRHRMRVESVVREAPGVVSLSISGRRLDRLRPQAGQFFSWRFLTRDAWWQAHPFSLSAAPDGRRLRITVKALGDFTERIAAIPPGTRVMAEGPFGRFTGAAREAGRGVVLIGGGIGITPLRAILEELDARARPVVIYRVIDEQDAPLLDELDELAASRGGVVHLVAGHHRGRAARGLLSPTHLRRLVGDLARREVFLCGPPAMADATEQSLTAAGVPQRRIHIERFAY